MPAPIATEADYQRHFRQLEHLLEHAPDDVAAIRQLGDLLDHYENTHGHRPVAPGSLVGRLELEMLARNLSRPALADLLGVAPAQVEAVLNGQQTLDLDLARRLHRHLAIPGDFLLEAA